MPSGDRTLRVVVLADASKGTQAFGQLGAAADKANASVARAGTSATKATGNFAAIGKGETPMRRLSGAADALGIGMGGVAGAAGIAGAATLAFAKDSVQTAATFDATMRQVAAATDTPMAQLGDLRKLALDLGASTKFSAQEAGDAMLELAKGGFSAAQIKGGALQSTLTLAAAGGLELGEAASFMVTSLGTFGLEADKATGVAAALAGGANASTASVQDLGQALAQVGPGARTAGLSVQETTAVLAAFANAGIQGSDAGTSLKTMLTRLVPTTKEAKEAMADLGLKFTDAQGNILPFAEVAEQLKVKLAGLSQEQRIAALNTIFGSDATRAATVAMNEGRAGILRYLQATSDRAAADQMAATNTEGAAGAMEQLSGSIETLKISVGTTALPLVEKLADAASFLAGVMTTLNDKTQGVATTFATLQPVLTSAHGVWNSLKATFPSLRDEQDKTATSAKGVAAAEGKAGQAAAQAGQAAKGGAAAQQQLKGAQNATAASTSKLSEEQEAAAKAFEKVKERVADAIPVFSGYKAKSDVTAAAILKNLKQEVAAYSGWAKNVQTLLKRGADPEAVRALSEKGPEYVAAFAHASDKELAALSTIFKDRTKAAGAAAVAEASTQGGAAGRAATTAMRSAFNPYLTPHVLPPAVGSTSRSSGRLAYQHGGVLTEPIIGIGTRSGIAYTLAEAGPEAVIPLNGALNGAGGGHRPAGAGAGGGAANGTWGPGGIVINFTVNGVVAGDLDHFATRATPHIRAAVRAALRREGKPAVL